MKAMLYGSGSGKKPTYAKYHRYASKAAMPEVGEDWEIAVISATKPSNDRAYIGTSAPTYSSAAVAGGTTSDFSQVLIKTDVGATTRGEVAENVYVPMQRAVRNISLGDGDVLTAYLYVPKSSGGYADGVWMPVGWNPLGRHLFNKGYLDTAGCTLEATGEELYSKGSVTAGASRIYTTASEIKAGGTNFLYKNMHATVSVDESYSGTRVRLGMVKTQSYMGGNPATSKYAVYKDFKVTAGKDTELTLSLGYGYEESVVYAAFGAYNAGSTAINIPLRVKRWWLE